MNERPRRIDNAPVLAPGIEGLSPAPLVLDCFGERLAAATRAQPDWPAVIRVGIECVLEILAADPRPLALTAVEMRRFDREGCGRYDDVVDRLVAALREGRAHCGWDADLPELTERVMIEGTLSLLAQRAAGGGAGDLCKLAPDITYFFLVPYLGVEAALRASGGAGTSPDPPAAG